MFCVYKIVNKLNGKIYVGVHNGKNNKYMGSGKLIRQAIEKYGIEQFEKRILYRTEFEILAYKLEQAIVTEKFVKRKDTYNLKVGGIGGRNKDSYTQEEKIAKSKLMKKNNPAFNFTDVWRKNQSEARKGKESPNKGNFKKEDDGKYIGTAHKGKNNPMAKKIFIFNSNGDIIFKCHGTFYKILKENNLPSGIFIRSLREDKPIKPNYRYITKNADIIRKYEGWYAKYVE